MTKTAGATGTGIIMMDWTRHNEVSARDPNELLWQQAICALVYDEVAVQDETIVCSRKLARWFFDDDAFPLLTELFECGGLTLLKRPLDAYPPELQDVAHDAPLRARRLQLERHSVGNAGQRLTFGVRRENLQDRLDAHFRTRSEGSGHRFAGSKHIVDYDLFDAFNKLLLDVLTAERWQPWLSESFDRLGPAERERFAQFVRDPHAALAAIEQRSPGDGARLVPSGESPYLSTAMAVRATRLFLPRIARQLQDLVETVFARPYCIREGADGRYGRYLHDLPSEEDLPSEPFLAPKARTLPSSPIVQPTFQVVPLPALLPGFGQVVATVRGLQHARDLRAAMATLDRSAQDGNETGVEKVLGEVRERWREVSDDLAFESAKAGMRVDPVTLGSFSSEVGEEVIFGILLAALSSDVNTALAATLGLTFKAATSRTVHLMADSLKARARRRWHRVHLRRRLRRAVEWRVVHHLPNLERDGDG